MCLEEHTALAVSHPAKRLQRVADLPSWGVVRVQLLLLGSWELTDEAIRPGHMSAGAILDPLKRSEASRRGQCCPR